MTTRFELVVDHDQTFFQLRETAGGVLLRSLGSRGKITSQNEILHLRRALRDPAQLVPHKAPDGSCFVVVKDLDGTVLARSPQLPDQPALDRLITKVMATYDKASVVDCTKRPQPSHDNADA